MNGTLAASTGSTANLFLINNQGISFGPEANLELGGSFTSSTANEILFDDGVSLASNTPTPATASLLKVSQPIGLGFLANNSGSSMSAPITVSATGNLLVFGSSAQPNAQFVNRQFRQAPGSLPPGFPTFSALSVQPSESVRLIGNGVTLTGGNLIAESGTIEIGSVAVGEVHISPSTLSASQTPGSTPNTTSTGTLSYDKVSAFSDITLSNSASLDVSAPNPGQIFLASRNLSVGERSAVLAETLAGGSPTTDPFTGGGLIDIQSTGLMQVSDVPPGTPGFPFFSYLSVDTAPNTSNPGGLINLQAQNLTITDGAQIGANTFGAGQAGTLRLTVDDQLSLIGLGEFGLSAIFSAAASPGTGDAGRIFINTTELLLQDGGRISTTSETTGATGSIKIDAKHIQVEGTTPVLEDRLPDGSIEFFLEGSAIESDNRGSALEAGLGIEIVASQVLVTEGGQITAATAGPGNAGNVTVTADEITVSGRAALAAPDNNGGPSSISTVVAPTAEGNGSTVTLNSRQISVLAGGQISTGTVGLGNAGNLIVNSDAVLISGSTAAGKSGLFASAIFGPGNGGNLTVNADQLQVLDGGTISVSNFPSSPTSPIPPGQGAAGNLTIEARQIVLQGEALLNADTAIGDRGNINITTEALALRTGSRITTNATAQATGGNININATDGFILALPNENSDITANAEFGRGGRVNIVAQDVLGIEARPALTEQSDITTSSEFGAAGETRLETLETEIREDAPALPESTDIPAVAQGCNTGGAGRFVQTGRGGTGTTPYGILNSRNSLPDVSLPSALATDSPSSEVAIPLSTTNPGLTEAQNWTTNTKGEVVLLAVDISEQESARCLNWRS
ncbi:MAG: hypothetical protein ACFB0D_00320 [Phormidesmis sp.]